MEEDQSKKSTMIALRSVFRDGTWYRKANLDTTVQKRVSKRFYEEIITKLELITNTKSKSENETYEQNDHEDLRNKSDFDLIVNLGENTEGKKELSIKGKADSIAAILMHGKFDVSSVHELEKICAHSDDLTMQSFTAIVEELFYSHMARFTDYYLANPKSCLNGKLKQSMEEYMSVYTPIERMKKHAEKEKRILKKAEQQHLTPKQLAYLHTLLNSIK